MDAEDEASAGSDEQKMSPNMVPANISESPINVDALPDPLDEWDCFEKSPTYVQLMKQKKQYEPATFNKGEKAKILNNLWECTIDDIFCNQLHSHNKHGNCIKSIYCTIKATKNWNSPHVSVTHIVETLMKLMFLLNENDKIQKAPLHSSAHHHASMPARKYHSAMLAAHSMMKKCKDAQQMSIAKMSKEALESQKPFQMPKKEAPKTNACMANSGKKPKLLIPRWWWKWIIVHTAIFARSMPCSPMKILRRRTKQSMILTMINLQSGIEKAKMVQSHGDQLTRVQFMLVMLIPKTACWIQMGQVATTVRHWLQLWCKFCIDRMCMARSFAPVSSVLWHVIKSGTHT